MYQGSGVDRWREDEKVKRLLSAYETGHLRPMVTKPIYAKLSDLLQLDHFAEAAQIGNDLIRSGKIGAVILAGGLASRFGSGPKAAVPLVPGWPLLRIKLALLENCALRLDVRIQVRLVVSSATRHAVTELIQRYVFEHLEIGFLQQTSLPRIDTNGNFLLDEAKQPLLSPPGHGEIIRLLQGSDIRSSDPATWQISNIDNLVATLEPVIAGVHAMAGTGATVEVTEGTSSDVGGYIVKGSLGVDVAEGFQVSALDRPSGRFFFSTNTFWLNRDAIADVSLPYYAISKRLPNGEEAVQFEQLLGDVGKCVPLRAVVVQRSGVETRFYPLKTPSDLAERCDQIVEALSWREGLWRTT